MPDIKFDHTYVSVIDMDRAIKFYAALLDKEAAHREENTWADFDMGSGVYFGLIDSKIVSDKRVIGNNAIPVFRTDDVDAIFEKVKGIGVKIFHEPETLEYTDYFYRVFLCYDTEGNLIEIAQYERE